MPQAAPLSITLKEANAILADAKDGHYRGELEYPPKYIFATEAHDAIAAFTPPVPWHFKIKLPGCLELTRLWQSEARRQSWRVASDPPLSKFLRACLRALPAEVPCVFSYCDPEPDDAGAHKREKPAHTGNIYRMARFRLLGQSRETDYWRTPAGDVLSSPVCYRVYHTKSRKTLAGTSPYTCSWTSPKGETCTKEHMGPGLTRIPKPEKFLFVYPLAKSVAEVRAIIGGRYAK